MGVSPRFPLQGILKVWAQWKVEPHVEGHVKEKYLEDLIEKLRKTHEIAAETAGVTQNNYARPATIIEITRPYSVSKVELDDEAQEVTSLHSKGRTSWVDLRSRLRFQGTFHYAPTDMAVTSMGDVTDHISSDCQELEDFQRLKLLNTLKKILQFVQFTSWLSKSKGT
ncbi:hypothetical protein TNCV_2931221 [Trichonephila clavipes]|nr:hypothetical protein TNCV_2931221 [Trichonephila clavipes]